MITQRASLTARPAQRAALSGRSGSRSARPDRFADLVNSPLLLRVAPIIFVLIWSTGWISARFGAPYADPLTFLALRYVLAGVVLSLLAVAMRASWPARRADYGHAMMSGVLLHAIYLGGVWWAIRHGLPAGISGLIAAVQPILTALLAPMILGERISRAHWIGILLGFA